MLIKNIIALFIVQVSNYAIPLLVLPYLSRTLGLDGFGAIMIMMSLFSSALIFSDYGIGMSAPYWIAKESNDKFKVSRYIGSVLLIKSSLGILISSVVSIYLLSNSDYIFFEPKLLVFCVFIIILSQSFQSIWFFQGIEKLKNVTVFTVISKITYLVLVFLFVKSSEQIENVIISFAISNFIAAFISIYLIFNEGYTIKYPSKDMVFFIFKNSFPFFLSRVAVSSYTTLNTFLVGAFSGTQQAALYSSAEKLYQAGQSTIVPISQALYPYAARTKNHTLILNVIFSIIPIVIVGCGFVIFFSDYIIHLFYGSDFLDAATILRIFTITFFFSVLNAIFGYPLFAAIGRVELANRAVYIGGIGQAICIGTLYIRDALSAQSIAIVVLITEFLVLFMRILMYVYAKKKCI